jgi:hypothetical protein
MSRESIRTKERKLAKAAKRTAKAIRRHQKRAMKPTPELEPAHRKKYSPPTAD